MELVRTLPEERTVTMVVRRLGRFLTSFSTLTLPLRAAPSAAQAQAALQIAIIGRNADGLRVNRAEPLAVVAGVQIVPA
jgi:hypothetical protein